MSIHFLLHLLWNLSFLKTNYIKNISTLTSDGVTKLLLKNWTFVPSAWNFSLSKNFHSAVSFKKMMELTKNLTAINDDFFKILAQIDDFSKKNFLPELPQYMVWQWHIQSIIWQRPPGDQMWYECKHSLLQTYESYIPIRHNSRLLSLWKIHKWSRQSKTYWLSPLISILKN